MQYAIGIMVLWYYVSFPRMTQPEHRRHAHAPLRHIADGPMYLGFSSPNLSVARIEGNGRCPKLDEGFAGPNLALCRV